MKDVIADAVERVIRSMSDNLGEQITIDDMARTAMFSKFHFTRIFQRVTGVSPGRFLSALRIQEAKRLLVSTTMSVADISHVVGYNSIGTFSSRFHSSVGLSPTDYRQFDGCPAPLPVRQAVAPGTVVRGHVWSPPGWRPGLVAIGMFPDRIAQGAPVRHTARAGSGAFVIEDVPAGLWHVFVHAEGARTDHHDVRPEHDFVDELWDEFDQDLAGPAPAVYVSATGPVEVRPGHPPGPVDLWLRPVSVFDPPILLAHLDQPVHTWLPRWTDQVARPVV